MIDAAEPASKALTAQTSEAPTVALKAAADAAVEGARSTADIVADRGRASYVGEVSRGVLDPGAVAVAIMIQAAAVAAKGESGTVDTDWIGE